MGNFLGLVYGTLQGKGIDTSEMSTEEVIEKFNELGGAEEDKNETINKSKPLTKKEQKEKEEIEKFSNYIKERKTEIKDQQKGIANENNFFHSTIAEFEPVEKPNREPDYISTDSFGNETGSVYWYTKDGVIRGSDHWGKGISSCDWGLKGEKLSTDRITIVGNDRGGRTTKYGFCKWEDFSQKPEKLRLNGEIINSNFENLKGIKNGWAIYEINGKTYYGSANLAIKNLYEEIP